MCRPPNVFCELQKHRIKPSMISLSKVRYAGHATDSPLENLTPCDDSVGNGRTAHGVSLLLCRPPNVFSAFQRHCIQRLSPHLPRRTKDHEVVEYALSRAMSPALVAEYQTRMPDKKLLQAKLHEFYQLAESEAAALKDAAAIVPPLAAQLPAAKPLGPTRKLPKKERKK